MSKQELWGIGIRYYRRRGETTLAFRPLYYGNYEGEAPPELMGATSALMMERDDYATPGVHDLPNNQTVSIDGRPPLVKLHQKPLPLEPWCGMQLTLVNTDLSEPPRTPEEHFLRLTMMSAGKIPADPDLVPGLFGAMPNVAWTNYGPVAAADLDAARARLLLNEGIDLVTRYVDKIPHMLDFVRPEGVRIADAARVRLGAQLGPGTTVMQAGFINACATVGEGCMIEGRVSFGTKVGNNTDLGGGSSMQGTLSGGGKVRVTVGHNCLIGANGGTGICLGDECTIAANLYVSPGLTFRDMRKRVDGAPNPNHKKRVKAHTLSGQNRLLFVLSKKGRLEIRYNKNPNKMNEALQNND